MAMFGTEEQLMTGEELARHPELDPCELAGFSLPLSELFRG